MFKEHNYVLWGDYCTCGQECFILQNKFHPWDNVDFTISIECTSCKKRVTIDNIKFDKDNEILTRGGNHDSKLL